MISVDTNIFFASVCSTQVRIGIGMGAPNYAPRDFFLTTCKPQPGGRGWRGNTYQFLR